MVRITIMLDDDIATKLRNKQAKAVIKSKKTISFSRIVNQVLAEGLKKGRL